MATIDTYPEIVQLLLMAEGQNIYGARCCVYSDVSRDMPACGLVAGTEEDIQQQQMQGIEVGKGVASVF